MSFRKTVLLQREAEPTPGGGDTPPPADDKLKSLFGDGYGGPKDEDDADDTPPPPEPPKPAEPEPPKPTDPKPGDTPAPVPPVPDPPKPSEVSYKDWKEALKAGADKYEVLKELGYDDFTIGMLKYKEQTGDVTPYLEVKTVDFTKMSDDQILMLDIKKANPGLSEKSLRILFDKEIAQKYYTNREEYPENSDEAVLGLEKMKLDAENKRKQFIEEQSKFKAPEPQPDTSKEVREAALQQQRGQLNTVIMNDPVVKALNEKKVVTFGEGEESFNYPAADTQALIDAAVNYAMSQNMTTFIGPDLQKFLKVMAIAPDPDAFELALGKHHQAVAHKKFQAELQNVKPPPPPGAEVIEEKDLFGGGYKTRR